MGTTALPDRDHVTVTADQLDPSALLATVADPGAGAGVVFVGTVRDHSPDRPGVVALEYEAYREVVEGSIAAVVAAVRSRHAVIATAVAHRVGRLAVGEAAVVVAVSAAHRDPAFAAAREIIDGLKATAPIWKKEFHADGAEWV